VEFDDRLDGFPEVIMPLWGMAVYRQDKHPEAKGRFWRLLNQKHRALERGVDARVAHPKNLAMCEQNARTADEIEAMANRDPMAEIRKWMRRYEEKTTVLTDKRRDLDPAEDIPAKMQEVTPQMVLRPLPRVEREEPDETEWDYVAPLQGEVAHRVVELGRKEQMKSLAPELLEQSNMAIMRAHRSFHQKILHRTDWTEYLCEDKIEERKGPRWMWRIWEHSDPLLDPMPMDERPSESGYVVGDEVYSMRPREEE